MKRIFIALICTLFSVGSLLAVPALPVVKTIRLTDGTTVQATLCGDEALSYFTLQDGQTAISRGDGTYRIIPHEELKEIRQKRTFTYTESRKALRAKAKAKSFVGKKKALVILVNFLDEKMHVNAPLSTFKDFFNKIDYNDYGNTGSVRDYFLDQSYGNLDIEFDVVGPYTLAHAMSYYGAPREDDHDSKAGTMVAEACLMADEHVNFKDYDWDGNGDVDQVFVVYAGYGQAQGGDENTIWPHEYVLRYSDYGRNLTLDGVTVSTYACSCELRGKEGIDLDGIGTACHEFSHCLGLPDMYDTSEKGSAFGMGSWDLMCSGSYNNGSHTPAPYTSYERWVSGWLEPVELSSASYIEDMKAIEDAPEAYILYNEGCRTEYYMLENRQPRKWDKGTEAHGLLVLHVDYNAEAWYYNNVNSEESHQRMTVIPADNVPTAGTCQGDTYPGTTRRTQLTDTSTPAAKLFNANIGGSKLMGKPITEITEKPSGLISFAAMRNQIDAPEVNAPVRTSTTSLFVDWSAVEDATSYELSLTEFKAAADNAEEATLISENFSKCYNKSVGLSNIAARLDSYLSTPGWTGTYLYQSPNYLQFGKGANKGTLTTPKLSAPLSSQVSFHLRMAPASGSVNVKFSLVVGNSVVGELTQTVDKDKVLSFYAPADMLDGEFKLQIVPQGICYIKGATIYDGNFPSPYKATAMESAEVLPLKAMPARRKANDVVTYKTTENSYEFTELNPKSSFALRVRAVTELGYSSWSDEIKVDFPNLPVVDPDAILSVEDQKPITGHCYDLQGRPVAKPDKRGIYVRDGKKVVY